MTDPNQYDELAMVSYITQRRTYDVLMRILANINPGDAEILVQMHEEGVFATPEPALQLETELDK